MQNGKHPLARKIALVALALVLISFVWTSLPTGTKFRPETRAVFTIISKNYLDKALTLFSSIRRTNPDIQKHFLCLVDTLDHLPPVPGTELIHVDRLGLPETPGMIFRYNIVEVNAAFKSAFAQYIFRTFAVDKLIYFDPDLWVTGPLDQLWNDLDTHDLFLTPHITEPFLGPEKSHPGVGDLGIIQSGTCNAGVVGMRFTPTFQNFLFWWHKVLIYTGQIWPDRGLLGDQKWLDLAPSFLDNLKVTRDKAYHVAYWNLHERGHMIIVENGKIILAEPGKPKRPVVCFHFSAFPASNHMTKISSRSSSTFRDFPNLRPIWQAYADELMSQNATIQIPYGYNYYPDGTEVHWISRKLFTDLPQSEQEKFRNPFLEIRRFGQALIPRSKVPRFLFGLWMTRIDLQQQFANITQYEQNADKFMRWFEEASSILPRHVKIWLEAACKASNGLVHNLVCFMADAGNVCDPWFLSTGDGRRGKQIKTVCDQPVMALRAIQTPLTMGPLTLKNRVIMSALTRNRCPGTIPNALVATYYGQRASAGLIVSEGIFIEPQGSEWPQVGGLWNDTQIQAWKEVTKAVHDKGGLIFAQLWHIGRVAHPLAQAGQPCVSASDVQAKGGKFRQLAGQPGFVQPVPIADPWAYIEKYRQAAKNAALAGFDGVEIHSANGYLPSQFIESHSNKRTDEWGGSPEGRAKFVTEIAKACVEVFDPKRVGIKLSPCGGYNDMGDPQEELEKNYGAVIKNIEELNIGYITICRHVPAKDPTGRGTLIDIYSIFRHQIKNAHFFTNGGFSGEEANKFIEDQTVSAVAFGAPYIPNPDLADRIFNGQVWDTNFDFPTFYYAKEDDSTKEIGYTSYKPFQL